MKRTVLFLTVIWLSASLLLGVKAQQQEKEKQQSQNPTVSDPISGEWNMVMQIQGMSIPYKLRLKLEGDIVTGSIDSVVTPGEPGGSAPISKGSFTGDKISFTFDRAGGSVLFTGTVKDGKFAGEYGGNQFWQKWEAQKKDDRKQKEAEQSSSVSKLPQSNIEGDWEGSYMTFALQNNEITQQLARLAGVSPQELGLPLKASFKKNDDSYTGQMVVRDTDLSKGDQITNITFGSDQKIEFTAKPRYGVFKGTLSQDQKKITGNVCNDEGVILGRFTLGMITLHSAAQKGVVAEIEKLLARGADINTKNEDGQTPLLSAVANQEERSDAVKFLLNKGADANAKDKNGQTALMLAARNGHSDSVVALLEKGADVGAKDANGKTAMDHARYYDNIKKLLKNAKAKK